MMKDYKRIALSTVTVLTMAAGSSPALALAASSDAAPATSGTAAASVAQNTAVQSNQVAEDVVEGQFAYDQTTITPTAMIAKYFRPATNAACNATTDFAEMNPLDWKIAVSGDVQSQFIASVGDVMQEDSVSRVMTCTCGGNPAGGKAIINADVKGIPVEYLLQRAGAAADVNTVTFISSDGTTVSMPLAYVIGRHGVLSYQINGEDLSASVGGNNQLWMTRTSAKYFVRDVTEIVVSAEPTPPAAPGENDVYPNSPNAGILAGAQD